MENALTNNRDCTCSLGPAKILAVPRSGCRLSGDAVRIERALGLDPLPDRELGGYVAILARFRLCASGKIKCRESDETQQQY